jgi:acetyl esterase/lipase
MAGQEILADVFGPSGNAIRPVIVSIHGGALIMGNRNVESSPALEK